MRATHTDRPSKAESKGVALRTGKIHLSKASASTIRSIVGVKLVDERLAARALGSASKSQHRVAKAARRGPAKHVSKAASKKR